MRFLFTWVIGPLAAFLPARWRSALPLADAVPWERAAAVSGFLECVAGLVGIAYWYLRSMTPMISGGADFVLSGGTVGQGLTEHQIAGAALLVFATHPLTLLLACVFAEGALRMLSAFIAEDARGSFPLYLLERFAFLAAHPSQSRAVVEEVRRNLVDTRESFREWLMVARTKAVPDEHLTSRKDGEQYLEIGASRRKDGWDPPKIVQVDGLYYRLEQDEVDKTARSRPFRYRLRRLEAGVPGRNVIVYRRPVPGKQK